MVNQVILIGRLGRDPESRFTSGGQAVCNASLATDEKYKDRNGERKQRTTWHKLTLWGKAAENFQKYAVKGSLVFIDGQIEVREWDDNEGKKHKEVAVRVNNFKLLGGKDGHSGAATNTSGSGSGSEAEREDEISDEDIPF